MCLHSEGGMGEVVWFVCLNKKHMLDFDCA